MITVTLLTIDQKPIGKSVPLQLVTLGGEVICTAEPDDAGVVSFDVDAESLAEVAIRFAIRSREKLEDS